MILEDIIDKLVKVAKLSRKEIMNKINEKKKDLAGLMTDKGAAYIIAKEYKIDLRKDLKPPRRPITAIKDLDLKMTLVNVIGRVGKIFEIKTFIRKKDKSQGRVGNFILEDKTGQIRIVLWDNQTEIIDTHQVQEGDPIYIENGNLRSGLNGLEVHIGRRGKIDNPPESLMEYVPEPIDIYHIEDLKDGLRGINVHGVINWKGEVKTFQRKDGSQGQVMSIFLRDETGSISCSIWNEKAEQFINFEKGDSIRMDDVSVKKNNLGDLQINVNINTIINREKKSIAVRSSKGVDFKISELTSDSKNVNLILKVIEKGSIRDVTSKSGKEFRIADILVADETGCINLTAWNDDIEQIKTEKVYELSNGYINEFRGSLSLNVGKYGELKPSDLKIDEINLKNNISLKVSYSSASRKYIENLKEGNNVQIRGAIVKVYEKNPLYESCPKCMKKVTQNEDESWQCPKCGKIDKKVDRMIWSFVIDDGTDNIRITVGGDVAEKLLGFNADEARKIMERELYAEAPLKIKEPELLGREIILIGTPKINEFTEKLEIFASKIDDSNPIDEAKIILTEK